MKSKLLVTSIISGALVSSSVSAISSEEYKIMFGKENSVQVFSPPTYDENGFDSNGNHKITGTQYDESGYDINGFDLEGYDISGFDSNGIGKIECAGADAAAHEQRTHYISLSKGYTYYSATQEYKFTHGGRNYKWGNSAINSEQITTTEYNNRSISHYYHTDGWKYYSDGFHHTQTIPLTHYTNYIHYYKICRQRY